MRLLEEPKLSDPMSNEAEDTTIGTLQIMEDYIFRGLRDGDTDTNDIDPGPFGYISR